MGTVPHIEMTDNGWVAPTEEVILAAVLADENAAFGGNLNLDLKTPQGQRAVTTTAIIGDKNAEMLGLFNGFDPQFAAGRQQDALARIWFLERKPAQPTAVIATVTGAAGTVIPAGSPAQATDGNLYGSVSAVTIPGGGSTTVEFQCQTSGPIACPAHTLTRIYRVIPGWDTIDNPADGTPGSLVESREEFEARRQESRALNAVAIIDAIQANVLAVDNVLDAYTTENTNPASTVIGGVTLVANSLYVCAAGGADDDIAQAIWTKKAPGCSYNGSTTVVVTDENGGYSDPKPTYTVAFQRPTSTPIYFAVVMRAGLALPSDYQTQVKNAIIGAFAGTDGGPRARIGSTLFALRYYSPIRALGDWAEAISIAIGNAPSPTGSSVNVDIDQLPTISAGNISVTAA